MVSGSQDSPYRMGQFITYTCPPGFVLNGPNASICTGNGEWEPDPGQMDCIGDWIILLHVHCERCHIMWADLSKTLESIIILLLFPSCPGFMAVYVAINPWQQYHNYQGFIGGGGGGGGAPPPPPPPPPCKASIITRIKPRNRLNVNKYSNDNKILRAFEMSPILLST